MKPANDTSIIVFRSCRTKVQQTRRLKVHKTHSIMHYLQKRVHCCIAVGFYAHRFMNKCKVNVEIPVAK